MMGFLIQIKCCPCLYIFEAKKGWAVVSSAAYFSWIVFSAAAKSRQSCPTLCNPIDGSAPGSRPWDFLGKNTGVGCHFLLECMKVKSESDVAQSCPTLSNPMDCSPPGSSVHGILQARALEGVPLPSRAFSANPPETSDAGQAVSVSPDQLMSWCLQFARVG